MERFTTFLRRFIMRTIDDLTDTVFIKQMVAVLVFSAGAIAIILANMDFLETHYPDPVRPDDFFLDRIPETNIFIPITDVVGRIGAVMMISIMWQEHFRRVPKLLFLLAAMYILRSFAIILNPLAQIHPPEETYAASNILAQNFYHGMFFSGHTASAFMQVFFIQGHRLQPIAALIACIQVFTLLASHQHYSIDIFGGFFVAYFFIRFDFMTLVPSRLRRHPWMPWYVSTEDKRRREAVRWPAF